MQDKFEKAFEIIGGGGLVLVYVLAWIEIVINIPELNGGEHIKVLCYFFS